MKAAFRIAGIAERSVQPCDIQLRGDKVASYVFLFCCGHRRIKLDQDIAGFNALSVVHIDGPDDADLKRLYQLNPTAWDNLTVRIGDDVDMTDSSPR